MTAKEALKKLKKHWDNYEIVGDRYFKTIELALNRLEKLEKVLKIIKEIDKTSLLHFIAVCVKDQDKFNLLKEYLK